MLFGPVHVISITVPASAISGASIVANGEEGVARGAGVGASTAGPACVA